MTRENEEDTWNTWSDTSNFLFYMNATLINIRINISTHAFSGFLLPGLN